MSKVHILTFHNAINYGAVLQCAALYKTIQDKMECDVIDYRSPKIELAYQALSREKTWKQNIRGVLVASSMRCKRDKFQAFLAEYVSMTPSFYSMDELRKADWGEQDVFCVVSDQVWNLDLTNQDAVYFFAFTPQQAKRISYAASIGKELPDPEIPYFQEQLKAFDALSVRERMAQERLKEIGIACAQHLDPVYLLMREEWEAMSISVPEEKEPYVLVFLLQKSKGFLKKAIAYAKVQKKKLVVITAIELIKRPGIIYVNRCGPQEFIRYLMKADTIFTNSFHGISLSIILNKMFYFEYLDGKFKTNSRLQDIITLFGLEAQNAGLYEQLPLTSRIDYISVNQRIEKEQKASKAYLMQTIHKQKS